MKKNIALLFILCLSCSHSQIEKKINITYYKDSTDSIQKSKDLSLIFTIGFNTSQHFKIYVNNILLKRFTCKTDYSTGLSFLDNEHDSVASLLIPYSLFKKNSFLRIETDKEYFKILITEKARDYNTLYISKDNNQWQASFENSSETQIFE